MSNKRGRPSLSGRKGRTRGPEIAMQPDVWKAAAQRAREEGLSLAEWVRRIISRELNLMPRLGVAVIRVVGVDMKSKTITMDVEPLS